MGVSVEQTLIVGGGLAAVRTAQALRDGKYPGRIVIASDEACLPYDRPPLSKNYLLGKVGDDAIRLLSAEQFVQLDIDIRLNKRATALDRLRREVEFSDGSTIRYDALVIATGANPIRPGLFNGYGNVHFLRTAQDAKDINSALKPNARIGIVGGGFIGLEIAAVAKSLGCEVCVVEAAAAPLTRALGVELGQCIQRWHERKGIAFRCGVAVRSVLGQSAITEIELADGQRLPVDAVIVGVGQKPNVDWLANSGLELHHGLVCDATGKTLDSAIHGVGDAVCRHISGKCHPTLHWTATGDQALQVAQAICGIAEPEPFIDDHYFWSDQHGARLQFVGQVSEDPQIIFASGSPEEDTFVALCCAAGEVTAVLSLGNPRDFLRFGMPLRRGERVPIPTEFA